MLFRNRPPENGLELRINNVIIPRVACTKFLGILIDESLNWKPHIQSVKSKLCSTLSVMYKASKFINTEGMLTLYYSLFLPYISYCNEIWGNTYSTNVNCLYILQKKAIRLMFCADRLAHTNEIFKDLSILKVLLYINDICNISNFVKFVLFADDTNIFCSSNSLHDLQNLLNRELAKLFVWFCQQIITKSGEN